MKHTNGNALSTVHGSLSARQQELLAMHDNLMCICQERLGEAYKLSGGLLGWMPWRSWKAYRLMLKNETDLRLAGKLLQEFKEESGL